MDVYIGTVVDIEIDVDMSRHMDIAGYTNIK